MYFLWTCPWETTTWNFYTLCHRFNHNVAKRVYGFQIEQIHLQITPALWNKHFDYIFFTKYLNFTWNWSTWKSHSYSKTICSIFLTGCRHFTSYETHSLYIFQYYYAPSYNHMEKADFSYFEVEAPNGIILIMFRDSSMTFSAKIRKKKN